ncbi:MAG: hypothetical protein MJY63_01510 [Paludibacteraceae bacterium]|nr:hypothetical protein [Paludibacteraceae bacterium]
MVEKLLASLAMACMTIGANAVSNYMTVEKNDGSLISFLLADNPVITYQNDCLIINKDANTTYSFDDIKNYHFTEEDVTAAESISAIVLKFVWIDDATIEIQNAQSGAAVSLTAVNGVVVSNSKVDADGKATVKIPNNKGVYVISAGKQSFKIIRK